VPSRRTGQRNPDEVRARWLALQVPGAVDALRADREAAVADVVWMEYGSEDHLPEPYCRSGRSTREGQIALFHIGHDEAIGFEFLDGGDLLFFGDRDAVCARQWHQLTVSPSSC